MNFYLVAINLILYAIVSTAVIVVVNYVFHSIWFIVSANCSVFIWSKIRSALSF